MDQTLGAIGFLVVLYLVCADLLKGIAVTPSAAVVAPGLDRSGRVYSS